jgi:hypothetical protein
MSLPGSPGRGRNFMKPMAMSLAFLFVISLSPLLAEGDASKDREVDESKVYFGDSKNFENPAVLQIAKVFDAIPEYRDAKTKGKDDPQYYILLEKANQKFFTALEKIAKESKYDLVGETGSIKMKDKDIPDVTASVIKALPR